jgi:hypothetical protein
MDYQKAKIYVIRSHKTNSVYIGATTQSLSKRMAKHRSDMKIYEANPNPKSKNNCRSREIVKYDDSYIELVEDFPCENKEQLNKREGEIIRSTRGCVNRCVPGRTDEEKHELSKQRKREYHIKNREKELARSRAYKEAHRQQVLDRSKAYRESHREQIREARKKKVECECGTVCRQDALTQHKKTLKHQKYVDKQNEGASVNQPISTDLYSAPEGSESLEVANKPSE